MKVLIKIIAIFFLLRIMGGYAQMMPSFSSKEIRLEEVRSVAEVANPKTLIMEIDGVSEYDSSIIYYEIEPGNDY